MNSAAALGTTALSAVASPNDTVRIACVGLNGRGKSHMQAFTSLPNVDLVALCDVDDAVMAKASKFVTEKRGKAPVAYSDLRKLLGVHIVGEGATELIHIGQAVIGFEGSINSFVNTVFN